MTITPDTTRHGTQRNDFINADRLLTDKERGIRDRVRDFVDREVIPKAADYWDKAEFPFELLPKLGRLGIVGATGPGEYGCAGWNNVAYGLALAEISRGSGSLATFIHVQSGMAVNTIDKLGSEEQKEKWIPAFVRCEKVGCFALTEPEAGSDPGSMQTIAARDGDGWVIDGEKRWIGNASFADVAIVWARTDAGKVHGFLVETGTPGFLAENIPRKGSQRAVWQARVTLDNCRIPEENRLPGATELGSTLALLAHSRYGVAWDGLGQAIDCYETALAYARERGQFGSPLASFQLTQQKLVRMLDEISLSQLLSIHMGRLKDAGELTSPLVSMFKMSNVSRARQVCALAREVLGGNGILLDYRVMEHMADIEGVYTYEGTHDVNTLIVGQAITGYKAFAGQSQPAAT